MYMVPKANINYTQSEIFRDLFCHGDPDVMRYVKAHSLRPVSGWHV
jgi:hypothetical protein